MEKADTLCLTLPGCLPKAPGSSYVPGPGKRDALLAFLLAFGVLVREERPMLNAGTESEREGRERHER